MKQRCRVTKRSRDVTDLMTSSKFYLVRPRVLDGVDDDVWRFVLEDAAVLQNNLTLDATFCVLRRLNVDLK